MTDSVAKALADAEHRARELSGLGLTVERKKTDRYRIEERTVFIVCKEKSARRSSTLPLANTVALRGDSWTENGEEVFACDTLEAAQAAMARYAEIDRW